MKIKEKEVHVRPAILHHTHTCKRIAARLVVAGGTIREHVSVRAGIMAGAKQAASDVGERESWKEKKTDVCRDAGCK